RPWKLTPASGLPSCIFVHSNRTRMPEFRYTARNTQGQLVDGTVTANDRAGAIAQVEQKRCVPINIQAAGEDGGKSNAQVATLAPAPKHAASLSRESSPAKSLQAAAKS